MNSMERAAGMAAAVFGTQFAFEATDEGTQFSEQIDGKTVRRFSLEGIEPDLLGYTLIECVMSQRLRDAGYDENS